jgi:hypothetical protein
MQKSLAVRHPAQSWGALIWQEWRDECVEKLAVLLIKLRSIQTAPNTGQHAQNGKQAKRATAIRVWANEFLSSGGE